MRKARGIKGSDWSQNIGEDGKTGKRDGAMGCGRDEHISDEEIVESYIKDFEEEQEEE